MKRTKSSLDLGITIGKAIKELREIEGFTRHALAKRAGIDPAVLARIEENARPGVQFATVCKLATALGASLDTLAAVVVQQGQKNQLKTARSPIGLARGARAARALLQRALKELDAGLKEAK
jgi:transcriptional regulator with XRE-family HTH domain